MAETTRTIESVVASACGPLGLHLVDVELRAGTLRVTIERPGAELDLDEVAAASKAISSALDANDEVAPSDRYLLEVSTPGVERRLRRPEHYVNAIGETVAIRLVAGEEGDRRLEGSLVGVDEQGIELELRAGRRRIPFGAIERAHTSFDWKKALASAKHDSDGDKSRSHRAAKRHHARGGTRADKETTP